MRRLQFVLALTTTLCAVTAARAEDHGWVLEIGPAAEWPLQGDMPNYGATIAVEREVIDGWLEIELGASGLWTSGRGELSYDLLFKKPFTLSPTVELMVGAGPSFSQPLDGTPGTVGISFALDLMVWPQPKVGWFIEPTYSVVPGSGQSSMGATAGILFRF